ncbi:hypothetical protein [Granulicoccus sp. GXG6511]|uniref:hypothetical protein n=1 Tax=Granulicoccus sp. GXG6511 TaxID=3381351 RepID=UPI003D7CA65B
MHAIAAQISHLTKGIRTLPRQGHRVLDLLAHTPAGDLDDVLSIVDVPRVIAGVRNSPGGRHRAVDLLLRERLGELSDDSLARTISAFHRGCTSRYAQEAIVEVMTARTGSGFNELKYRLNSTGDLHDLEHLVFEDLDEDLSDRLLEHIADQADDGSGADTRILCDIDDTVKCMLHDRRYPRGTIYPGAIALLKALDHGAAEEADRAGDLTFVTARPSGPRGLIEGYTRGRLSGLGLPPHTVMGGSFLNIHTKPAIAERKIQNMERDRLLFPETRMVFIGDSGQADGQVGAEMHARDPKVIVGTFLHNVTGLDDTAKQEWAAKGVHVFDTYAGAAAHALRLGLIRAEQARAVAADVRLGLDVLHMSTEQRRGLHQLLAADTALIEAASTTTSA